jgi:ecotin
MKFRIVIAFIYLILSMALNGQNISDKKDLKPEQIELDSTLFAPIQTVHDLTIYPNIPNMVKNVINIQPMANESLYRIEFYAVKSTEVDDCNKHYLLGDFEVKNVEGYGYPYYIFNSNQQIISTKMGCGNDVKKIKNVPSGKTETIRYLSLLPIVIYTPQMIDVKYKIWKQDPKELDARSY